jgi:hypothetical protein
MDAFMDELNFKVSKEEYDKANEWFKNHRHKKKIFFKNNKPMSLTYCFVLTHIGIGFHIECSCGEKIDLTDYNKL